MVRVTPANNNGSIRVRFRFLGNSYTVPICGKYHNRLDRAKAEVICAQIELDVESGRFDDTLERYSSADPKQRPKPPRLLKVWDLWVESLDLSEQVKVGHYRDLRAMILRSTPDPLSNDVQWFNQATGHLAASTHNLRLGMLKACMKWAIGEKLVKTNPYTKLKRKKPDRQSVKPLSLEEMAAILKGFEARSPSYAPYVAFLFMTGVRNSEASGLQWKRVDWARGEVTISDSLSTVRYSKSKVRKPTKTGVATVLSMNAGLRALLESIERGGPDDLIFKSPKGKPITINAYWRMWSEVLKTAGIPHVKPYTSRHSLASHAIDKGMSLPDVAYLLGHANTRMVSQTYGHIINRPTLPDLNLGSNRVTE